jgi:hypothetical protein
LIEGGAGTTRESAMTSYQIGSMGTGTSTGQSLSGGRRSRRVAALAGLLLVLVILAVGLNWWDLGRQSAADDVPTAVGISRQLSGLHVIDAYLVPAGQSGAYTVVASFTTTSGGPDRLLSVSAGGGAPVAPEAAGSTATQGLAVGPSGLTKVGPEPGAHAVTVAMPGGSAAPPSAGTLRPGTPGTFVRATFDFANRGPFTVRVPVWASLSGSAA